MKNVKKWLAKWLVVLSVIASVLMGVGSGQAWASGVPVQSGTTNIYSLSGSYQVFPYLTNEYYGSNLQINATMPYSSRGWAAYIEVVGSNDGTNWTGIANLLESADGQSVSISVSLPNPWNQIKATVYYNSGYFPADITAMTATLVVIGADQQTAQTAADNATNAMNAANSANTAAQAAQTAATNAANGTNTIINSYLSATAGVVQDNSGTVLNAARLAQTNALNAYNSANQADTDIKSAQTNLSSQITNNFNNLSQFLTPNLKKISGANGATATSGSSMQLVLDYNNATDYRYSVDGGSWSGWSPLTGTTISVPLSTQGSHTIVVQIRNGSGSTAPADQSSINVFKL